MNSQYKKVLKPVVNAIRGGFLYILSGSVLTKAITMISSILIARLVTKELYAYYSYAANLYSYIELLNGLELSGALLVFCSKTDSIEKGGAYLKFSTAVSTILQLVISIGLCVVVTFVNITFPEARRYIYLYLPIPALSVVINNIQSYNRAYGQNKRYSAMGVVRALIIAVFAAILVPIIQIEGLIYSRYLACVVVIVIGGIFCVKNLKGVKIEKITQSEVKEFLFLGLSLFMASFFSYLMPLNETFLVNTLIADETITANFKVAGLIPQQLSLISGSICVFFYPSIAKTDNKQEAWKKVFKVGIYTAVSVIGVAVIGIMVNPLLIRILYGTQYLDAIPMSRTLWIMRMIHSAFRAVPMTLLPALGDKKYNMIASPIFCLIHVTTDYFLILKYGIMGVAFAAIAVYLVSGVSAWIYLYCYCRKSRDN